MRLSKSIPVKQRRNTCLMGREPRFFATSGAASRAGQTADECPKFALTLQYGTSYVEALAEQSWKGLWLSVRPTPPWKWRRGARESVPAALGGSGTSRARFGNGAEASPLPGDRR